MNPDDDERPKSLQLPGSLVDPGSDDDERGGADEDELSSVRRAIDAAGQRPAPTAEEAAEASERRRLIDEIHAMRRIKPNLALHAAIQGAKLAGLGLLAWHAVKAFAPTRDKR